MGRGSAFAELEALARLMLLKLGLLLLKHLLLWRLLLWRVLLWRVLQWVLRLRHVLLHVGSHEGRALHCLHVDA